MPHKETSFFKIKLLECLCWIHRRKNINLKGRGEGGGESLDQCYCLNSVICCSFWKMQDLHQRVSDKQATAILNQLMNE